MFPVLDFKNAVITLKNRKRSFRAAFKEMKAYSYAKLREDFHFTGAEQDGKEPFFLNKYHSRISTRSFRRRVMSSLSDSYNMRDLQYTYRQITSKVKQELARIVP